MARRNTAGVLVIVAAAVATGCPGQVASDAQVGDATDARNDAVEDALDVAFDASAIDSTVRDADATDATDVTDAVSSGDADGADGGSEASVADAGGDGAADGGDGGCTFPPAAATGTYNEVASVAYYQPGGVDVTMSIVWPTSTGPHPLVIVLHPGGWVSGSASNVYGMQHRLVSLGYTVAAPNYRLATSTSNTFPAAVQDVRCAVRWLRANASTYGIDPTQVIVWGLSSGANLGAMISTIATDTEFDADCPVSETDVSLRGFIGWYGVYDLRSSTFGWDGGTDGGAMDPSLAQYVTTYLGAAPEAVPTLAARASPLLFVDGSAAVSLIVAGTDDSLVPVQQSRDMYAALQAASVPVTYIETPNVPTHGLIPFVTGTPREWSCASLDFLSTTFH